MIERAEYHPEWTPDCQGKWDYDCNLVSLSRSRTYTGIAEAMATQWGNL